jgi:hypothetical protein
MTSISAFNEMMDQFMVELKETFPEEKTLGKYYTGFDILKTSNPKKCVTAFMEEITPYASQVMNKDETFFLDANTVLPAILEEMHIREHWTTDISQNTKDAIWQYLQTLYMLGTTITSIPSETLDMIEAVAKQCADTMQGGGGIDEKTLMSSMSGLFGGLLKNNK